jgi:DNA-binding transcriptional MerR regulator
MNSLLDAYRHQTSWTIDDLVHLCAEVIPALAGPQWRHKVTEIPDARTIRYYIQEGLVDRPHGTAGQAGLYGYRHLLQLAAIKVLQSRYLPIRRIREEIRSLGNEELEGRLDRWTVPADALLELDAPSIAARPRENSSAAAPAPRAVADRGDAARRYLESLAALAPAREAGPRPPSRDRTSSWSDAVRARVDSPARLRREADELPPVPGWRRFELFPGIELQIREGIEVPEGPSFLSVLASRLRAILEDLRNAKSRDKKPGK